MSDSVLKPDFYESSFIATDNGNSLPMSNTGEIKFTESKSEYWFWAIPVIIIITLSIYFKKRNQIKP